MSNMPKEQMVRTYTAGFGGSAEKKFSKDLAQLQKQGWRVLNQSSTAHPWTGKVLSLVVVYEHAEHTAQSAPAQNQMPQGLSFKEQVKWHMEQNKRRSAKP